MKVVWRGRAGGCEAFKVPAGGHLEQSISRLQLRETPGAVGDIAGFLSFNCTPWKSETKRVISLSEVDKAIPRTSWKDDARTSLTAEMNPTSLPAPE